MTRPLTDPRIVEVLAAFDVACKPVPHCRQPNLVDDFMHDAVHSVWGEWGVDCSRAVLIAHLVHAPEGDLDDILTGARGFLDWRRDFVLQCEYEDAGLGSCYSDEFEVWREERLACQKEAA